MLKLKDIFNYMDFFSLKNSSNKPIFNKRLTTACFSGPRYSKLQALNVDETKISLSLKNIIINSISDGYKTFLVGCCDGFDILAAEAVLNLKTLYPDLQLVCVVPFKNHYEKFNDSWQKRYFNMLRFCDKKIILQKYHTPKCYQRRNEYMANRSSLLICCFNNKKGGTKNMVEYCKNLDIQVENILDYN